MNSFAIGQMMHQACFEGQKPGAFMLATALAALGLSSADVVKDFQSSMRQSYNS
ncbi:MAG: hypothetical protein ACRDF4_04670 [Rhabdochlamydiaceae bacterium]